MIERFIKFHHLGLLTQDTDISKKILMGLGYKLEAMASDPLQGAELSMFLSSDSSHRVELVFPFPTNAALLNFAKRRGEIIYHICYSCRSISDAKLFFEARSGRSVVTVSDSKPARLFGDANVAFFLCAGFGLVELIEADPVLIASA